MTTETENVAVLKSAYSRWSQSKGADPGGWLDVIGDDFRLRSLPDGVEPLAFTSERRGRDEFMGYIEGLSADWEMIFYHMDDFIARGDRVVVLGRISYRNRRTGKAFETPKIDVWRMEAGKAKDYLESFDTAKVLACTS